MAVFRCRIQGIKLSVQVAACCLILMTSVSACKSKSNWRQRYAEIEAESGKKQEGKAEVENAIKGGEIASTDQSTSSENIKTSETTESKTETTKAPSNATPCLEANASFRTEKNYDRRDFGKYVLRNNIWGFQNPGAGAQRMWAVSETCFGVESNHVNATGLVKGYPQAILGWSTGDGFFHNRHGLGMLASQIKKADIAWDMEAPNNVGRYFALWDIYFHDKNNPGPNDLPRTSLMIFQKIRDADLYSAGQAREQNQRLIVDNQTYLMRLDKKPWAYNNTIILYLAPDQNAILGQNSHKVNLKAIIDRLIAMGHISNNQDYLTSVQIGWEIIDGAVFKTTGFMTDIQ